MRLQNAAPKARFHLMGHSFGCIVVSATVAGPAGGPALPRPVDSLFLVQGALSLWSYASDIPYAAGTAGYFNRIVTQGLVRGPIVTTRSTHDTAVGTLLSARRADQEAARPRRRVAGVRRHRRLRHPGREGRAKTCRCGRPRSPTAFAPAAIYNLEASDVIKNGSGASGAHSDIAHPEVAHAFWAAALG